MEKKGDIVYFAKTNYRGKHIKFGIKEDDRRRHMYVIGKTGMGKSTVLENMIVQDIKNGKGVALVDPHGDFAEKILNYIPSNRVNDVIYFNPADIDYPIAFNVMETVAEEHKHLIASGLVGVFKKLWVDSWGPRLEYVLRNAILALLDYPGSTLLGVMRILVDKNFRKKVISRIQDPVVKSFWVEEYSKYPDRFQAEAIAPIQNKVGQFLSTALIRNVVGQVKSTINIREIMDKNKILIMNLSKGRIGEDASSLLGAMMITKIQLAAMSRIDIPESQRQDFYLYVDEFQNFATESFANILSEARKYRLDIIIAHQYIEQVEENVRAAVFGNVGSMLCFRIGAADAEFLLKEFEPYFTEEDLVNLTKYDIYLKLMIDGVSSNPFSATTLDPLAEKDRTNNAEKIIIVSRERYSKPKEIVEEKIARWSGNEEDEREEEKVFEKKTFSSPKRTIARETLSTQGPKQREVRPEVRPKETVEKPLGAYVVECYECGNPTEVNFRPDGIRPVYCKKCFKEIREKLIKGPSVEAESEEIDDISLEKPKEISLTEALNREPVSFYSKKQKQNERIQSHHVKTNETIDDDGSINNEKKSFQKAVRPGEVIRI